ncbi:MAG: glutamine amidotransferase [Spirochaetia bacterium]|jgi:uncharacterized membrane protein
MKQGSLAARRRSLKVFEIEDSGAWFPLLADREIERGRVSCWMTGASPHWGINFMKWREYDRFWMQLFTSKDG